MHAKKKYLSNGWQRLSKVLAMFFGAYAATAALHIAIAKNVTNDVPILLTSTYTSFILWVGLMVMVFIIKRAWIAWSVLSGIVVFSGLLVLLK